MTDTKTQTTKFSKAWVVHILWWPIGFPFFFAGLCAAFAIDAFKSGKKYFKACIVDLVEER